MPTTQDFGVIASRGMQKPLTVAATATVIPQSRLTFLTGTTQVANITPLDVNAYQEVLLCFTNAAPGAFLTTGNIKTAYQPIQNRPILMCWDPSSVKWWAAAVV